MKSAVSTYVWHIKELLKKQIHNNVELTQRNIDDIFWAIHVDSRTYF